MPIPHSLPYSLLVLLLTLSPRLKTLAGAAAKYGKKPGISVLHFVVYCPGNFVMSPESLCEYLLPVLIGMIYGV